MKVAQCNAVPLRTRRHPQKRGLQECLKTWTPTPSYHGNLLNKKTRNCKKKASVYPILLGLTKKASKDKAGTMKSNRFNDSPHQFTCEERKSLEKSWKVNIKGPMTSRLSIGKFAEQYGIVKSTLSRELNRGCVSPSFYDYDKHRWCYSEYSAQLAQEDANAKGREKGPRGKLKASVAKEIIDIMKNKFSVCTARSIIIEVRRSE